MSTMFERAAQVNARFAGGSSRQAEVVEALRELGLEEGRITVIARADPGDWREPAPAPGFLARLLGRRGGEPQAGVTPPPPDLLIMVHLGLDDALAEPVQGVFHRFGAAQVDYYPSGRVPSSASGSEGAAEDGDAALFRNAFPDAEQRQRASDATASRHPGGQP